MDGLACLAHLQGSSGCACAVGIRSHEATIMLAYQGALHRMAAHGHWRVLRDHLAAKIKPSYAGTEPGNKCAVGCGCPCSLPLWDLTLIQICDDVDVDHFVIEVGGVFANLFIFGHAIHHKRGCCMCYACAWAEHGKTLPTACKSTMHVGCSGHITTVVFLLQELFMCAASICACPLCLHGDQCARCIAPLLTWRTGTLPLVRRKARECQSMCVHRNSQLLRSWK
jgi:hypothetical protein